MHVPIPWNHAWHFNGEATSLPWCTRGVAMGYHGIVMTAHGVAVAGGANAMAMTCHIISITVNGNATVTHGNEMTCACDSHVSPWLGQRW